MAHAQVGRARDRHGGHVAARRDVQRAEWSADRSDLRLLPSRVGSACCYWNRYGTQCSHPAQGRAVSTIAAEIPDEFFCSRYLQAEKKAVSSQGRARETAVKNQGTAVKSYGNGQGKAVKRRGKVTERQCRTSARSCRRTATRCTCGRNPKANSEESTWQPVGIHWRLAELLRTGKSRAEYPECTAVSRSTNLKNRPIATEYRPTAS